MRLFDEKEFTFIIGSPRSGTTWLQVMLAVHPKIASTVELTLYSDYLAPMLRVWKNERGNILEGRWTKGLPHILTEQEFQDCLSDLLEKTYSRLLKKKPVATHILEKAPENSFHVGIITKFIPKSRFIHIIRDGRDVVCSMRNVRRTAGHQTSDIAQGAALWKRSVLAAQKAQDFGNRYLELRYEKLLENGPSVLKRVYEFIGIPISIEEATEIVRIHSFEKMKKYRPTGDPEIKGNQGHYYKGKSGTWKDELVRAERDLFRCIAGDLLVELGYANSAWLPPSTRQHYNQNNLARSIRTRMEHLMAALLGERLANRIRPIIFRGFL